MNEERAEGTLKAGGGWRKAFLAIGLLLVVIIVAAIWVAWEPKEPTYGGKPFTYWLKQYEEAASAGDGPKGRIAVESREAMRQIGTNALPVLMRMVQAKDSALKLKFVELVEQQNYINFHFSSADRINYQAVEGFYCLGDLATSSIPALIEIYKKSPSESSKEVADTLLKWSYPVSSNAPPYWVPAAEQAEWCDEAGQIKSRQGALANAILAYSEAIKLNSTNGTPYLHCAYVRMQLGDFKGGLADAKRSVGLDKKDSATFFTAGLWEYALKDYKNAEADFSSAVNLNTNHVEAYNYRGLARGNLRRMDEALADFNKAIELSPSDAAGYRNRALVERLQKDFELALADVSRAIELDKKDADSYLVRGRIKTGLKEYEAAKADYDKALELYPNAAQVYCFRGANSVFMNDFENASVDLEKAVKIDPKNVVVYVARGYLKMKRGGDDDGARVDFEHAVELGPQSADTHGMLGLFQYKIGERTVALENCRKALDIGGSGNTADLRSYVWLIRAQNGEAAEASKDLEAYLATLKGAKANEWEASIARFFSGSVTESDFLSQATSTAKRPSAVKGQLCEAFYYAGMKRKLAGDKPGAMELFQKSVDTGSDNNLGYMNAGIELRAGKSK